MAGRIPPGRTSFGYHSTLHGPERRETSMSEKAKPVLVGDEIKVPAKIHRHRLQFRAKLLENPNYFGNLKASAFDAVSALTSSVIYKECRGIDDGSREKCIDRQFRSCQAERSLSS